MFDKYIPKSFTAVDSQWVALRASGIDIVQLPDAAEDIENGQQAYTVLFNGNLVGTNAEGSICFKEEGTMVANCFTYRGALWLALGLQTAQITIKEGQAAKANRRTKWILFLSTLAVLAAFNL